MPNINDRIGSQNVIRVLSNASAPPTRLVNLTDVNSASKTKDGVILVWDVSTETFFMTDTVDSSTFNFTGITSFSNTTQSNSKTTGAVVVGGGLGIGKNVYIGEQLNVAGTATFGTTSVVIDGNNDIVNVGTGITLSSSNGIDTPSIRISGPLSAQQLNISGISTLASSGGITTTGGNLYVGGDLYVADDIVYDEAQARNWNVTGIATAAELIVTGLSTFAGISTFQTDVFVAGTLEAELIDGGEF